MGSLVRLLPPVPLPCDAGTVQRGARHAIGFIAARAILAAFAAALLTASPAAATGASSVTPAAASTADPSAAPTAPPTADSIRGLIRSARYTEAEAAARALLAREERLHGANSVEVADALDLLGESLRYGGKGAEPEARDVYERAVRINEAARGPDDLNTARSLTSLGILLFERSQYGDAGRVLRRALDIRERALGPNDKLVAQSLQYLAVMEYQTGRDSTAMPLIERAIQIYRATLPPDDPRLGDALNVLASLLYYQGDYARAGPLYEQVLDICLKAPRRDALRIATCHQNLGSVHAELQENEQARHHLEEALQLRRHTLGSRHPLVGSTLSTLAYELEELGDVTGARAHYEEALRIQRRVYGAGHSDLAMQHSDLAWTLMHAGRLEAACGRYSRARAYLQQALGIQERTLGENFPDLAWTLSGLATVAEGEHHPEAARGFYVRALGILEQAYGPVHPDRIRVLNEYAGFLARAGDSTRALDAALRSATARAGQLALVTRGLAERQALRYLSFGASGLDLAIGLAARGVGGDPGVRDAWDAVIHSRTLVLDEMASRQNIAAVAATDSDLAATFRAVDSARRRYAGLLVRGARDEGAEQFRAKLDHAREDMERAERALAATSLRFRADEARARIGLKEVIEAIPGDATLVAFAVCDTGRAESYVAFIARPGSAPCLVSLGRAAAIDPWIDRWVQEIMGAPSEDRGADARRAETSCRTAGAALRRRIWDPVAARLGPAARVFVVPDGSLYRVNFAALPTGSSDYLVDSGPLFHVLTSERDLVPAPSRRVGGTGLLAFGGPSFDRWEVRTGATDAKAMRGIAPHGHAANARGPLPDCPDFRSVRFEPLPGATREVEEIARLWPDSASADVRTGVRASEPELRRLAPGRRVLHLATHGFFLDAAHCAVAAGRRGIGGITTVSGAAANRGTGARREASPLRLSGLALAGANLRDEAASGDEDGILTAEEVASLDLSGADWAVLSACDTGVGRVQTSEGVLGLRRAFRIAGARTVIMSLWSVDDQATLRWMRALYQARFRGGLETAEAVREAGRSVLREQRAQARSTHPFFWAGFVAAGDWR